MRPLFIIAILSFLISSCKNDTSVSSPPFTSAAADVRLHQTVAIEGTGISVRLDAIPYDGRLPDGVIDDQWWTNTAQTQWTVFPSGAHFELYVSGQIHDSTGIRFVAAPAAIGDLSFQLQILDPLPPQLMERPPDSAIVARIGVTRVSPPSPSDSNWLPMALGTRWIYLDSAFQGDSLVSVTLDTIFISNEYTDQNGHWFEWSDYMDPFGRLALVKGDSAFCQEPSYGPCHGGDPLYFVALQLHPPLGDSAQYGVIIDGDIVTTRTAVRLAEPVITGAGSFSDCVRFSAPLDYVDATEILCPHVGFVYLERTVNFPSAPDQTDRLWLQSCELH